MNSNTSVSTGQPDPTVMGESHWPEGFFLITAGYSIIVGLLLGNVARNLGVSLTVIGAVFLILCSVAYGGYRLGGSRGWFEEADNE